jgi:hypothetical protein
MKATIEIDDELYRQVKAAAAIGTHQQNDRENRSAIGQG